MSIEPICSRSLLPATPFFSNSYFERSTKLWDAKTGDLLLPIPDTTGPVSTTPNAQIYVIANHSELRLFDYAKQVLLPRRYVSGGVAFGDRIRSVIGANSCRLGLWTIDVWKFSQGDGTPALMKVASAKPYATGNWVVGLQFSPDGNSLYSVARSGAVEEWTSNIQPLVVIVTGKGHLHGFTHTYIGATLIGIGAALTGKYAAEFGLRLIGEARYLPISWPVTIISAFIGSYSHVLLDSLMHADLEPFAPFMLSNPFLGFVSVEVLHKFCLYSGLLGVVLYFAVSHWCSRHGSHSKWTR